MDVLKGATFRSCKVWKELFAKADLEIVREEEQKGFPRELFAVWMYALEES
jgi:hypothetical protein